MSWDSNELEPLLDEIWARVAAAIADLNHPFRTPALATLGEHGSAVRTVILRGASQAERQLTCYSDRRSAKIEHITRSPRVEWLFYDPTAKFQVRAQGHAWISHADAAARAAWEDLPLPSRMLYCARTTPGTEILNPAAAWPQFVLERNPTIESVEPGWDNFAIIKTKVERIDFLHLDWALQRRATFLWAKERYLGKWTTP